MIADIEKQHRTSLVSLVRYVSWFVYCIHIVLNTNLSSLFDNNFPPVTLCLYQFI